MKPLSLAGRVQYLEVTSDTQLAPRLIQVHAALLTQKIQRTEHAVCQLSEESHARKGQECSYTTNLCCTLRSTMLRSKFSDLLPTASAVQSLHVHEGVSHGHPAEVIICSQPFTRNSVYMHMHMLPTTVDQKHTALLKEACMHTQKALYLLRWLLVLW